MAVAWHSVFLALVCSVGSVQSLNLQPIIAIFGQPIQSSSCPNGESCEYIAASYIKNVESMGGRAVPLSYYASDEKVEEVLNSVNGLYIPGGSAAIPDAGYKAVNYIIEMNDNGTHFPLWGTCMGFEWLVEALGGTLQSGFDSENISLPLNWTADAPSSRIVGDLDPSLYDMLSGPDTSAFNNHGMGYSPSQFDEVSSLENFFNVISTSKDRNGKPFVSTIEAKDYPIYGVQWHPEKNIWEHGESPNGSPYENIPHSQDAIDVTLHLAQVMVEEARQNDNKYPDPDSEAAALIWQYPIYYTAPEFVQKYIADF